MSRARLAHLTPFAAEPVVFFTVVINGRRSLLANPSAHDTLRGLWERSGERNGWWVGDYVVMPDHVHLFARSGRSSDPMKTWVKMWKSVSAREIARAQRLEGSIWQKDYFDRYVRSAENYAEKWAYVEMNPVRAGLVSNPDAWPYRGRIHELRF